MDTPQTPTEPQTLGEAAANFRRAEQRMNGAKADLVEADKACDQATIALNQAEYHYQRAKELLVEIAKREAS